MLNTPVRSSVTAAELKVGDEIRRDGLRYHVTKPPTVEERFSDGSPACIKVAVETVKGHVKDALLYEAEASVEILRRGL